MLHRWNLDVSLTSVDPTSHHFDDPNILKESLGNIISVPKVPSLIGRARLATLDNLSHIENLDSFFYEHYRRFCRSFYRFELLSSAVSLRFVF